MARAEESPGGILVADHDAELRSVVVSVLTQAGYETLEVASGEEAIDTARRALPRLVILEVALPGLSGYEVCHQLRNEFGEGLPIVFVSADRTEAFDRVAGFLIGADDYLVKPFAADELLARVRRLARRTVPVPPSIASKLTKREMEVLRLLAEGLEQPEIASQLFITKKTVGTHIENIMRKLGVRSRSQAVALAYREDLLKTNGLTPQPS
jgi:DNA-binding NarL/FixJ family response regulator